MAAANSMSPERFKALAALAREGVVTAIFSARKGHLGGALSSIDLMLQLFSAQIVDAHPGGLRSVVKRPFILSKAHSATGLLAVLSVLEEGHSDLLDDYNTPGSLVGNNPSERVYGIELHAGSLGHGISYATGLALSKTLGADVDYATVLVGDGELHEGSCWEGLLFAAHHELDVCVVVDDNGQICEARTESVVSLGNLGEKFRAFGFKTIEIDGHSYQDLQGIKTFIESSRGPRAVIAKTVKGKGVSFMEGVIRFHHSIPTADEFDRAIAELRAMT